MTTLFLDTEFNSFQGELISIALVADDGREFYVVVSVPSAPHPWVAQHVLPVLGAPPMGWDAAVAALHHFLAAFEDVRVVADWPADHAWFFHMLDLGDGRRLSGTFVAVLTDPPSEPAPEKPHNALSDARALRRAFRT
jgi:hypothetical protein